MGTAKRQTPRGSRRTQIVDAAIELLGTGGERALSHGRIEIAAGVPPGTASNHFRTRRALLLTVCTEVEQRRIAAWKEIVSSETQTPQSLDVLAQQLATFAIEATDCTCAVGQLVRAHHSLSTLAHYSSPLQLILAESDLQCRRHLLSVLSVVSPATDELHAHVVADYLSGLISRQLATPEPTFRPCRSIRAILAGLAHISP